MRNLLVMNSKIYILTTCVYIQRGPNGMQIITVWVDDLLVFTITLESMINLKCKISKIFEVSDLREPNKIVGIKIS